MASYKKPDSVDLWESLPKNPSGKMLKKEIRKILAGIGEKRLLGVTDISGTDLTQMANRSSLAGEQWRI